MTRVMLVSWPANGTTWGEQGGLGEEQVSERDAGGKVGEECGGWFSASSARYSGLRSQRFPGRQSASH